MFKYIRIVLIVLPRLIFDYFKWMIKFSKNPEKYPIELRYEKVRSLVTYVLNHWPMKLEHHNYEYLKNQEKCCLIVPNHISDIDPLIFIYLSERPISFVAKKETSKYPFVGRILRIINGQFIDRDDVKSQIGVFREIKKKIEENELSYLIFAEGTRNKVKDSTLLEFHAGTLKPAYWAKTNIIGCSIYGSDRMLPTKTKLKYYPVILNFVKPFVYSEYKDIKTTELAPTLRDIVQKNYDESIKEYYEKYSSIIKKDRD